VRTYFRLGARILDSDRPGCERTGVSRATGRSSDLLTVKPVIVPISIVLARGTARNRTPGNPPFFGYHFYPTPRDTNLVAAFRPHNGGDHLNVALTSGHIHCPVVWSSARCTSHAALHVSVLARFSSLRATVGVVSLAHAGE